MKTKTLKFDETPCCNKELVGPCYVFRGCKNETGYGLVCMWKDGRRWKVKAHRYAWEQKHGPIPAGLVVDHRCRNRACINLDHLRIVTRHVSNTENIVGANYQLNAAKTRCKHGHEFDVVNTCWLRDGTRQCRQCSRNRNAAYKVRKKAKGDQNL